MGLMHVVLRQMEHLIVIPIDLTEHVHPPLVVLRDKHPIVLPIIPTERVQGLLVVQEQSLK